jgi:DNA-binding response OmpR family regulator
MMGHESRMASTGSGALEEASRFEPDIVILDLALPDISGLEVARALRSQADGRALHIAALTGCARAQQRAEALAAGFDQYVLKPGNLAALLGAATQGLAAVSAAARG